MVFKNINNIKKNLHGVIHTMMFYNNGIVFQTSFPPEDNIPLIGENLSTIINNLQKSIQIYDQTETEYKKLIFETKKYIIAILKLGEDSNLAILLDNKKDDPLEISKIRKFLHSLEEIIDMDIEEIHQNENSE